MKATKQKLSLKKFRLKKHMLLKKHKWLSVKYITNTAWSSGPGLYSRCKGRPSTILAMVTWLSWTVVRNPALSEVRDKATSMPEDSCLGPLDANKDALDPLMCFMLG